MGSRVHQGNVSTRLCTAAASTCKRGGRSGAKPTIVQARLGDPDHEAGVGGCSERQARSQHRSKRRQAPCCHPGCCPALPVGAPLYPRQRGTTGEAGCRDAAAARGASPQPCASCSPAASSRVAKEWLQGAGSLSAAPAGFVGRCYGSLLCPEDRNLSCPAPGAAQGSPTLGCLQLPHQHQ